MGAGEAAITKTAGSPSVTGVAWARTVTVDTRGTAGTPITEPDHSPSPAALVWTA